MTTDWSGRTVYLDANPWRVLRRLLAADPAPLPFKEARPWQRKEKDEATFARLEELGLVVVAGKDGEGAPLYRITARGKAAADLGEVHPEVVKATTRQGKRPRQASPR